tara:strand:- start:369 stop:560 length:192 start_codon:yes stop_codon:yes gene_type:complete
MSEPTIIDADYEVTDERGMNLGDRVERLEDLVEHLLNAHASILEHFREMVAAVTEISKGSSEE